MTTPRSARVSSRKQPQQTRSSDLVAAILDAAVQVLTKEGAPRFTTARVAERAGVSVGSLYQYFPNKAAILFRLQSDEWRSTIELLRGILEDADLPLLERLRALVHAFLRSECEEAPIRGALSDAAPLYRDAPEAVALRASSAHIVRNFLANLLPLVSEEERQMAGELVKTTLSAVGSTFSEVPRTPNEIDAYAGALADMLCGYLERLAEESKKGRSMTHPAPTERRQ